MKDKQTKDEILVPCGRCPECVKRRISAWSFRLMQEEKNSRSAHFITLTYDTNKVPLSKNGFMSINKRDLQLFFKRLRKAHSIKGYYNVGLKYYAVGEYGGKTKRPHYHLILFNCKIELIQDAWGMGHVHYGEVTGASVGYTLKYMCKPSKIPMHKNDDRIPEFSLMSKKLGASYLSEKMIRWHKADLDNRMHLVIEDGKKISMPRYFKDRIYEEEERERIAYVNAVKSKEKIWQLMEEEGENYEHNQRVRMEAAFKKSVHNQKQRNTV